MRHPLGLAAVLLPLLANPASAQESPATPQEAAPAATEEQAREASAGRIGIELNKIEPAGTACRVYFVVDNRAAEAIGDLQIDVYFFDRQGSILRGVALQLGSVRAESAKVAPFELPELDCGAIGRALLNDVLLCNSADGAPLEGCAEGVEVASRVDVGFVY